MSLTVGLANLIYLDLYNGGIGLAPRDIAMETVEKSSWTSMLIQARVSMQKSVSRRGKTGNCDKGRSGDGGKLQGSKEKLEDFNVEEVGGMDGVFGAIVRFE